MKNQIVHKVLLTVIILITGFKLSAQDIFSAAEAGNIQQVKEYLQKSPELLNAKNREGFTPLYIAAWKNHAELTKILLDMGADPSIGDNENTMPVHMAAIGSSYEALNILLDRGIDINSRDANLMTPLHFALSYRQPEMAKYLVERGADINALNIMGYTPLIFAISGGSLDMVKLLVSKKVNVNARISNGSTPLFTAVSYGRTEIVKYLIDHGADIHAKANEGEEPLARAINSNTYDAAKYLIEKGADVNFRSENRESALHNVAGWGSLNIAELLVEHGADINAVNVNGMTPLTYAAWSRNSDQMSRFLILNGAYVNPEPCKIDKACTCGPVFTTPLHAAAQMGKVEMAINLVSNGAKVNVYDEKGLTPLYLAVQSGKKEIVEYLIDHGSFINVKEKNHGTTELHLAVAMGYKDIADLLIDRGASLNIPDDSGKTPLDYAWYYGQKEIAYTLLAKGADDSKLKESVSAPDLLTQSLGEEQAAIWFLGHSGWAVKTQHHFLVFDYFKNTFLRNPDDTSLSSGFINTDEIEGQKVTVFSSHNHGDHYDESIFNWAKTIPEINYVLCWNPQDVTEEYTFIPINGRQKVDDMEVYVNRSTDLGGGYLVQVDGLTIFFMGDHANRADDLMSDFTREIDLVADMTDDIDILFGPVRGCGLGLPEQVKKGIYYTLDKLKPTLFVPMHAGAHSFAYQDFAEEAKKDGITAKMQVVFNKGDRFVYDKNPLPEKATD